MQPTIEPEEIREIDVLMDRFAPPQGGIEYQTDQPGKVHAWHSHSVHETLVVLSGTITLSWKDCAGQQQDAVAKAGQRIELPANTAVGAAGVAGSLLGGRLADRLGEFRILTYSTLVNGPILFFLAVTDRPVLNVAFAAVSVGLSQAFMPPAATVIARFSTPDNRVTLFAFYRIFINVGSVVAPAVAGFLGQHAFDTLFLISAVFSIVTACLLFSVRPTKLTGAPATAAASADESGTTDTAAAYDNVGATRVVWLLVLMALTMAIYAQHQSSIPLKLNERDGGLQLFSQLLILNPVLVILLELPLSFISKRFSWPISLGAGVAITGIGLAITGAFSPVWLIFLGYSVFTIGECLFAPMSNTAVANIAPPSKASQYQGYLSAVQAIGIAAGPAAGTAIYFATGQVFWSLLAAVSVLGGLAVVALGWRRRSAAKAAEEVVMDDGVLAPSREAEPQFNEHSEGNHRMKVLLLDPVSSGAAYPKMLQEHGVECIIVDTQRALISGLRTSPTPGSLNFEVDFDSDAARLADYCRLQDVGHHIVGAESAVPLAEALTAHVDALTRNDDDQPTRRWDKIDMAHALRLARVSTPTSRWADNRTDVARLAEELFETGTRRYVVKPSIGAGTVNVRSVETKEQFLACAEKILSQDGLFGDPPRVLVQEFVAGQEFVIDTFSIEGQHGIAAVCTYDKHPSSEGSFVYDRLRWLAPKDLELQLLEEYAFKALDALGVRSGVGHMEVIMTPNGPQLIDFGARPHGAGHPMRTFELTKSSQMHVEVAYAAALATGTHYTPPSYTLERQGVIEFFSIPAGATARPELNVEEIRQMDGVKELMFTVEPGKSYGETHDLLDGLALGLAFLTADTPEGLEQLGSTVRRMFLDNFIAEAAEAAAENDA